MRCRLPSITIGRASGAMSLLKGNGVFATRAVASKVVATQVVPDAVRRQVPAPQKVEQLGVHAEPAVAGQDLTCGQVPEADGRIAQGRDQQGGSSRAMTTTMSTSEEGGAPRHRAVRPWNR